MQPTKFFSLLCMFFSIYLPINANALEMAIAMEKNYFTQEEKPTISLMYKNNTSRLIKISERFAPTGEFWNNIFTLNIDGEKAKYIGKLYAYKYKDKPRELKPGSSIGYVLDLSKLYDLSKGGYYSIYACIRTKNITYKSNTIEAFIEGRDNTVVAEWVSPSESTVEIINVVMDDGTISAKAMRTYGCSRREATELKTSFAKAIKLAASAYTKIKSLEPSKAAKDKPYKTWYCKDKKKEKLFYGVRENWRAISQAINTKMIKFHCGCNNAIAFVFPHRAYNIYTCDDFFNLTTTGKFSQASVIVHEMSHFYATATTHDFAYGEKRCKDLVKRRPEMAVRNADNYLYFCSDVD